MQMLVTDAGDSSPHALRHSFKITQRHHQHLFVGKNKINSKLTLECLKAKNYNDGIRTLATQLRRQPFMRYAIH
jgi:hypothetical protein